jgi:hypothetical protein
MAAEYSQQTKPVCANTNDPTCKASQEQYDKMNMLEAQVKSDGAYDVPPSPPPAPAKTLTITQGFTNLQNTSMGLFVVAGLFIVYGLVSRVSKRRK